MAGHLMKYRLHHKRSDQETMSLVMIADIFGRIRESRREHPEPYGFEDLDLAIARHSPDWNGCADVCATLIRVHTDG